MASLAAKSGIWAVKMIYSRKRRNSEKIINVFLSGDIKAPAVEREKNEFKREREENNENFSPFASAQILSNVCSTLGDLLQRAPSTIIPRHYCVFIICPLALTRRNFFQWFFFARRSPAPNVWSIKTNFMLFMYLLMLLAVFMFLRLNIFRFVVFFFGE